MRSYFHEFILNIYFLSYHPYLSSFQSSKKQFKDISVNIFKKMQDTPEIRTCLFNKTFDNFIGLNFCRGK